MKLLSSCLMLDFKVHRTDRREEGYCKVGEEKQAGTHKYEPEPNEDRLKPMSAAAASDLDAVGVLQKPGSLVVKLNTHIWSRKQTS